MFGIGNWNFEVLEMDENQILMNFQWKPLRLSKCRVHKYIYIKNHNLVEYYVFGDNDKLVNLNLAWNI